ncbi:BTB/POZ protein, partial [Paraphoma chrysanthemicola]
LLNNATLSDVIIKQIYKGKVREYYAHKAILCKESEYFLKAFTGNFKEATESTMELHDDDPELFELALKFIYTEHYD